MQATSIFNRVLLLTDFSDYSRNAVMYAINALGNRSSYVLLNSYNCRTSASTFIDINEIAHKESEYQLKEEMTWVINQFPDIELDIVFDCQQGKPVNVVKKYWEDADLVVMGAKGTSKSDKFLNGSTFDSVLNGLHCPILCIPIGADYRMMEKVALANDLKYMSKESNMAVIRALKGYFNCDITSLSMQPRGWTPSKEESRLMELLNKRKFLKNVHIVENDNTSEALLTFCFNHQIDLLVVISRSRGFFGRIFKKNISQNLISQTVMPVLVL
ncbi:MAG: hypothetical protein GQ574_23190 [Crocinitomix sp.]|nr:hypothetical protein [Crocinitomix sp.]